MNDHTSSAWSDRQQGPIVHPPGPDRELGPAEDSKAAVEKIATLPRCRLQRVTEHVQGNLDKNLSVGELAALVSMSPYHFARLFKRTTGVPPHRFVVRHRIARARALLASPDLSIARIARGVGFRTPSHFTTVFRRATGVTPGAYRTASLREVPPDEKGG